MFQPITRASALSTLTVLSCLLVVVSPATAQDGDEQHQGDAENTDVGAGNNWRATAWEIHPVTDIRAVPCA